MVSLSILVGFVGGFTGVRWGVARVAIERRGGETRSEEEGDTLVKAREGRQHDLREKSEVWSFGGIVVGVQEWRSSS